MASVERRRRELLDVALRGYDARTLEAKILDPYPDDPPGSFTVMSEDFKQRMNEELLDAMVGFLLRER